MADEDIQKAGTASFFQRADLTRRLDEMVRPFFAEHDIGIWEFGQDAIMGGHGPLAARMKQLVSKRSPAALAVKFAPDFICLVRPIQRLFFMDVKTSVTPVLFQSKLDAIASAAGRGRLAREQVGVIEREAWDNYNNRFPPRDTAICLACPYNPGLVLAEWVANIALLFRFEEDINENAGGSQTPHVNIDLETMRRLDEFLNEEFQIAVDSAMFDILLNDVKTWPLGNPGRSWKQVNAAIEKLQLTCPWLRRRNKERWLDPPYDGDKRRLH